MPIRDYTAHTASAGSNGASAKAQKAPDEIVHQPAIVLGCIGMFGFIAGVLANFWQVATTFFALWTMFNVSTGGFTLDPRSFWQRQPVIMLICLLIATCAQYFLQMLVFRIKKEWKEAYDAGKSGAKALGTAAIHIVQQTDIVLILSALAFVVCTVSDFTFITIYTFNAFLIFAYAVALYAFSTVGFVRGLEYIWAALAAMYVKKTNS